MSGGAVGLTPKNRGQKHGHTANLDRKMFFFGFLSCFLIFCLLSPDGWGNKMKPKPRIKIANVL